MIKYPGKVYGRSRNDQRHVEKWNRGQRCEAAYQRIRLVRRMNERKDARPPALKTKLPYSNFCQNFNKNKCIFAELEVFFFPKALEFTLYLSVFIL